MRSEPTISMLLLMIKGGNVDKSEFVIADTSLLSVLWPL